MRYRVIHCGVEKTERSFLAGETERVFAITNGTLGRHFVTVLEMLLFDDYGFTFKAGCVIIAPKSQMEKRAHIFVFGRVQGVFFRDHTQRWASSLSLSGWVRNLYDGRVEIVVEGDGAKIEGLIAKLRMGPPMADVTNIEISWEDFKGEFHGFRITW